MKKAILCVVLVMVAGCASQPSDLQTAYVSDLQYRSYDCDQLELEAARVSRRANELHASLQDKADNDAAQMGVGLVLFWPTLFFLEGGDGVEAQEYSRLKGERDAIERVGVQKKCSIEFAPAPTADPKKIEQAS